MNKNTWDVNKDMVVKEQVTKRLEEMIHYCEKARKSQMVSVICKKVKR